MVGLEYLKYTMNESDAGVVEKFVENPYWQYFCGLDYFAHKLPCHPTSLVRWRQRFGTKGAELMLAETLDVAKKSGLTTDASLLKVYVDTTVQPKAIAYPHDSRVLDTARRAVAREANRLGIPLKQTYVRLGKRSLFNHARAMHRDEKKLARKQLRKLRTYLGRVVRDFERKLSEPTAQTSRLLGIVKKILGQKTRSKEKIYSVHAPEVVCIAKGKARVKYEFGSKVSIATATKGSWVIGVNSFPSAPFDGHKLPQKIGHEFTTMETSYKSSDTPEKGKRCPRRPSTASSRRSTQRHVPLISKKKVTVSKPKSNSETLSPPIERPRSCRSIAFQAGRAFFKNLI